MTAGAARPWTLKGTVLIACNCDFGCPCNFNALPTTGQCEGGWTWHIQAGSFGDITLDSLNFSLCVKWPGAIHHGKGEGILLVDERATDRQAEAISTLVGGTVGGPWGILAWTWPTLHGPTRVGYELTLDGIHFRVKAADALLLESTTIKNPVNGAEVHPGVVLPEGLIVKHADLGCSVAFRVNGAIELNHPGKYTAVGPFDYAGQ